MLVTLALGYSCRVADGEVACLDFPTVISDLVISHYCQSELSFVGLVVVRISLCVEKCCFSSIISDWRIQGVMEIVGRRIEDGCMGLDAGPKTCAFSSDTVSRVLQ